MNMEDARSIERPPIKVGEQHTFYSTMQQEYLPVEKRMRNYTGKLVTVVRPLREDEYDFEGDHMFLCRASDGFEFSALEDEINGFMVDTGQFFWPDATWGHDHDTSALANEKE